MSRDKEEAAKREQAAQTLLACRGVKVESSYLCSVRHSVHRTQDPNLLCMLEARLWQNPELHVIVVASGRAGGVGDDLAGTADGALVRVFENKEVHGLLRSGCLREGIEGLCDLLEPGCVASGQTGESIAHCEA